MFTNRETSSSPSCIILDDKKEMLKTEKSMRRASSSDRPSAGEEKTFGEDILIRVNRLECHVMGSQAGEQIEA